MVKSLTFPFIAKSKFNMGPIMKGEKVLITNIIADMYYIDNISGIWSPELFDVL